MPNHCYQSVYIKGPSALVRELFFQLAEQGRFCDVIIPMPLSEASVGYNWRVENWGTKWDVADVEIDSPYDPLEHSYTDDKKVVKFSFRCWTAWAPPIPVWDKLHEMGVTVEAEYEDEGGMFEGKYRDGADECWVPDLEEEAV